MKLPFSNKNKDIILRLIQPTMSENRGKRWRIVMVASPLQGHMTPMLQLGTYLHSKGFSITIAHPEFNSPDSSNHPDFIFLPLPDNLSGPGSFTSFLGFLQALNNNCKPHLHKHLVQIMKEESVVIIYDILMVFGGSLAVDLGLPSIIMNSSSAVFFPAYKIIPQLHQEGRFPVHDSLMDDILPELKPFRYKDLPFIDLPTQDAIESAKMITPDTPPSAFIWNTLEFLEPSALTQIRQQYQVPIFTIGPLHKTSPTRSTSFLEEDTSCITWLDKQKPKSVVYVSLGSMANLDKNVATEMAWGLVNSNHPFLWVVRPGSVHGYEWFEFLEEGLVDKIKVRGLIVKWAPQKEVLAHNAVGGFWSHCGWNSTLESVSEGVPVLCQPFSVDQLMNARYLSHVWKIGIEIVVEKTEIKDAIKRLLVDKEMKQRAIEVQENVKLALNHGGSSHNALKDLEEFILSL